MATTRSTGDLDVWVNESIDNQDRLAIALRNFGFSPQTVTRGPIPEKTKFLRIGNQPVRVEIHADISGVNFADCILRAETCDVQGIAVRFISLADLRANKEAAGRAKDIADLEALPKSSDPQ
jgi:predicted nucleotidyltransferase